MKVLLPKIGTMGTPYRRADANGYFETHHQTHAQSVQLPVRCPLHRVLAILLAAAMLVGCGKDETPAVTATNTYVAATNTYTESVARELLGDDESILSLSGPGSCPGHFDISPGQVSKLCRCRVLLRLGFQESLDSKLARATAAELRIVPVRIEGGLCTPDSYKSACNQVAQALIDIGLLDSVTIKARLAEITARTESAAKLAQSQIARTHPAGTAVLVSAHQEDFCRWLGLNVVATIPSSDNPGQLDRAIVASRAAKVALVIGNVPEGRTTADSLAESLGARVVMFDNFPAGGGRDRWAEMMLSNVKRLIDAGTSP